MNDDFKEQAQEILRDSVVIAGVKLQCVEKYIKHLEGRGAELEGKVMLIYYIVNDIPEDCWYLFDTFEEAQSYLESLREELADIDEAEFDEEYYITEKKMTISERNALPDS